MAAIGDVLVKFIADAAEFVTGVDKVNAKLDDQAKKLAQHGSALDGLKKKLDDLGNAAGLNDLTSKLDGLLSKFGQFAKVGGPAAAIALVVAAFEESSRAAIKYADTIDELSRKYDLTSQQAQGLEKAARLTGRALDDLAASASKKQLDDLAKSIGVIDPKKLDDLALATSQFKSAWAALGETIDRVAIEKGIGLATTSMQNATSATKLFNDAIVESIADFGRWNTAIEAFNSRVGNYFKNMFSSGPPPGAAGVPGGDPAASVRAAAAREQQQQAAQAAAAQEYYRGLPQGSAPRGLTPEQQAALIPPQTKPTTTGGGGGVSNADADSVDNQIARYKKLQEQAGETQKFIQSNNQLSIEQLQREVTVRDQVASVIAKYANDHKNVSKEQLDALTKQVTAEKQAEQQTLQLMKAEQDATAIELKYGDGTKALEKLHTDLAKAKATDRATTEALTRAEKAQAEQIKQNALEQARYSDNLDSLAAGFAHAANAYQRSNDLYAAGEQTFTGLTNAMTEGLAALAGTSTKTFGQIAADFATMLEQMAIKAAVSQVFKFLLSSLGPTTGDVSGLSTDKQIAAFSSYSGGGIGGFFSSLLGGGRASGGPVYPGQSYMVGEAGPERFVPQAAGTIVPTNQLGNSGGITVNVDMKQQQGARDPSAALEFGRRVRAAVVDVIANEKRPGGTLYARSA